MAARPPPSNSSSPDAVVFGIAALDARIDAADVEFPASSAELLEAVSDEQVPFDAAGNTVSLGEALGRVPEDSFTTKAELLETLHPVFEEYRRSSKQTFLERIRAVLPF